MNFVTTNLKDKVKFVGYVSTNSLPTQLKVLDQEIRKTLDSYKTTAGDKLEIEYLDPAEDQNLAKTIAEKYGFSPQSFSVLQRFGGTSKSPHAVFQGSSSLSSPSERPQSPAFPFARSSQAVSLPLSLPSSFSVLSASRPYSSGAFRRPPRPFRPLISPFRVFLRLLTDDITVTAIAAAASVNNAYDEAG